MSRTIAIDFDGVIHPYSKGWGDGTITDEPPVTGAIEAMKRLQKRGYTVVVHTARPTNGPIVDWLVRHWGGSSKEHPVPEITNTKPTAIAYIDDRAIRFTNWKDILNFF